MKRFFSVFFACCAFAAFTGSAFSAPDPRDSGSLDRVARKKTARIAVAEAVAKFVDSQSTESIKTYALFPVRQDIDDGYYTRLFEEAFTEAANKAGLELITAASSREFNQLIKTFEDRQDSSSAFDESTLQQIGKVIDYQAILLPRIDMEISPDGTWSLQASVKTIYREAGKVRGFGSDFLPVPGQLSTSSMLRYAAMIAGGLIILLVLLLIVRSVRRAARPR